MGLLKEFKEFASRGSVVDLAVGVIMGAAFGKIVASLVGDILMPPIGWAVGGVDFSALSWKLPVATKDDKAVEMLYGKFLQTTIDFLIIALAIFAVIKVMNAMKKKEEAAPAPPPKQEVLLTEIRDLLKSGRTV